MALVILGAQPAGAARQDGAEEEHRETGWIRFDTGTGELRTTDVSKPTFTLDGGQVFVEVGILRQEAHLAPEGGLVHGVAQDLGLP